MQLLVLKSLERVAFKDHGHIVRLVLDVVEVVGAGIDGKGGIGLQPLVGTLLENLDHWRHERGRVVERGVRRAAKFDELGGAERVAEGDDRLHHFGQRLTLLAVHDVSLLAGQIHLVGFGRIDVGGGVARAGSTVPGHGFPIRAHAVHIGLAHAFHPGRHLAGPGCARRRGSLPSGVRKADFRV
jgi:hypothetical protein